MRIQDEWRMFDPKDSRTHPEGICRVEIKYEDGRVMPSIYSRELGMSLHIGAVPLQDSPVKRWRYLEAPVDSN